MDYNNNNNSESINIQFYAVCLYLLVYRWLRSANKVNNIIQVILLRYIVFICMNLFFELL